MRRALLLLGLLAIGCGTTPSTTSEICGNGKDDDGNGKTDCDDSACASDAACKQADGGMDYGPCERCGFVCGRQSACLDGGYTADRPLPECVAGRCQQKNVAVQVNLQVDTSMWSGFTPPINSLNTRFVSKTGIDGGVVSCTEVKAQAMGKTEADAPQIEKSGVFNLRGWDVAPAGVTGGQQILEPFVNVGSGSDFLIWMEFWGGKPGTATGLPTGNRYGYGCFETGPEVAAVTAADDCSNDGGSCRIIKPKMPGPQ